MELGSEFGEKREEMDSNSLISSGQTDKAYKTFPESYDESKNVGKKILLGIVGLFGFVVTFVLEVFGAAG